MHQFFETWDVVPGRDVRVSVEGVIDDWEGFRVLVKDHQTDRMLKIAFDGQVAYQKRDESDLDGEAARSQGLGQGCFYRVQQSEFAARFQSDSARQFDRLMHFAIITDLDCVDVLTLEEPKVTQL